MPIKNVRNSTFPFIILIFKIKNLIYTVLSYVWGTEHNIICKYYILSYSLLCIIRIQTKK